MEMLPVFLGLNVRGWPGWALGAPCGLFAAICQTRQRDPWLDAAVRALTL